jgi:hypothetical protein
MRGATRARDDPEYTRLGLRIVFQDRTYAVAGQEHSALGAEYVAYSPIAERRS